MPGAGDKRSASDTARKLQRVEAENRRLRRARAALLGVQEASAAVASQLHVQAVLEEIVAKALEVAGGDAAAIFTVSDDEKRLEPQAAAGDVTPASLPALPVVPVRSRGWKDLRAQRGLIIDDAQSYPHLLRARSYIRERRIKSLLAVPLVARGRLLGALALSNRRRKRAFRREDLRVMQLFADQAALALDNSRLVTEAREATARSQAQIGLGKAIIADIRDPALILDASGRIVFGNRALFEVLGREPGEVIGRRWDEFVEPSDAAFLLEQQALTDGEVISATIRLRRPDGSLTPVMVTAGGARDSTGRLIGTAAAAVNFEEQSRMKGDFEQQERMVRAIGRLARAVGKGLDVKRLAAQGLDSALALVGVTIGVVYLVEGEHLGLAAGRGLSPEHLAATRRLAIDDSISGRAFRSGRPLTLLDVRRSPRLDPRIRAVLPADMRAVAAIPVPGRDGPIGVLALGGAGPNPFTPDAVNALRVLAAQLGAALESARLYQSAQGRAERLAALNQVAEQLISCSSPDEVVAIICRGLAKVLDARRVVCLDHDAHKELLIPVGGYRVSASRIKRLPSMRLSQAPLLALSVTERQPVLCADLRAQRALPARLCEILDMHAAVAVPVISRKELCGILVADNEKGPVSLSQDEKDMAMALANQSAVTLDNVFLLREEQARARQLSLAVQEAHHRIKNNLQAVCDLLELELEDSGGERSADGIQHSVQRVQAIALVHEFLSRHHDVATVDAGQVVERLVPLAIASNQGREDQVRAVVRADPVTLSSKVTTALALIVNELVSNAVRHGLNDGRAGRIEVELRERNGAVHLRVADDGVGLPAGFDSRTSGHVGLEIARVLAQRDLNGTITVTTRGGRARGTIARVRFPR